MFAAFFGVLLLLLTWRLPESLPKDSLRPLSFRQVVKDWGTLLKTLQFWHYAIIPCMAYSAYFVYIAEVPFLLQYQGIPAQCIGFSYISLSLSYVVGNMWTRRLLKTGVASDQLLGMGYKLFVAGGLLVFLATAVLPTSFVACILGISILTLGNGFLLPLGAAGAVTCIPSIAGSASGLMGFLQIASAALTVNLIGTLSQGQPERFGLIVLMMAVVGLGLFYLLNTKAQKSIEID